MRHSINRLNEMKSANIPSVLLQLAIAADQAFNTLVRIRQDGWGYADETLSARVFRCYLQGYISDRAYLAIDALFFWQSAHCYNSWRSEVDRAQLPNHYRGEP